MSAVAASGTDVAVLSEVAVAVIVSIGGALGVGHRYLAQFRTRLDTVAHQVRNNHSESTLRDDLDKVWDAQQGIGEDLSTLGHQVGELRRDVQQLAARLEALDTHVEEVSSRTRRTAQHTDPARRPGRITEGAPLRPY